MKAIIDGKLYDTETATEVERWRHTFARDDRIFQKDSNATQVLYRTDKGAHFLFSVLDKPGKRQPRWVITPVEDEDLVEVITLFGGTDVAMRLFPDRIEVA